MFLVLSISARQREQGWKSSAATSRSTCASKARRVTWDVGVFVFMYLWYPSFLLFHQFSCLKFYCFTTQKKVNGERVSLQNLFTLSHSPIIRAIESVEVCEGRRRRAGGFLWKLRAAYRVFWLPVGPIPRSWLPQSKGQKGSVDFCKQVERLELRSPLGNSSWSSLSFFVCFFCGGCLFICDCCCRRRRFHSSRYGNTMKTVAATAMNAKSSRAHTIFKLMVEKRAWVDRTVLNHGTLRWFCKTGLLIWSPLLSWMGFMMLSRES